jgi:hypothetical protein
LSWDRATVAAQALATGDASTTCTHTLPSTPPHPHHLTHITIFSPIPSNQVDDGEGGLVHVKSVGGDGIEVVELPLAPSEIVKMFRVGADCDRGAAGGCRLRQT